MRWLVENMSARVDVLDKYGNLPIASAAKRGHLEVMRYLVQTQKQVVASVADPALLIDLLQCVLATCPVVLPRAVVRAPKDK